MKVKVPAVRISQYCINGFLFADDEVTTAQSSADLQNALTLLESYCLYWSLEVNTKTNQKYKGNCQLTYKDKV